MWHHPVSCCAICSSFYYANLLRLQNPFIETQEVIDRIEKCLLLILKQVKGETIGKNTKKNRFMMQSVNSINKTVFVTCCSFKGQVCIKHQIKNIYIFLQVKQLCIFSETCRTLHTRSAGHKYNVRILQNLSIAI